jgi:hypothetical protein
LWYIIDERRAYSVDSENFQRTVLERLEGLKKGQERLESKVDGLEGRLNELEAKNATRHLQIETKLNVLIEDRKSIFEILGRHETEIAALKRKLG